MKIIKVYSNSLAETIGLKAGDRLLKINGKRVIDEIDYKFRMTEELLVLDLEINGQLDRVELHKEYDDDLGVQFEEMKIRACANDCVFCFVDQNPPNMRDGMYFRDGDYRMSYLYGHYITLTNMGQKELDRIVEQRMSPLYISVHVTNPILRKKLFLYKKDDGILEKLKFLTENNIELHTQIVLMPTINDNDYLLETLKDLYLYYPILKTCTIVPVGLTKHRKGLMEIPIITNDYAREILDILPNLRMQFPGINTPFILCSDEWYILANKVFPHIDEYTGIDLIENGVGQVPDFINRFYKDAVIFPNKLEKPCRITLVTGTLIYNIFKNQIIPVLNNIENLDVNIISIENNFYGNVVTVSGLLTGQDIIKQLKNKDLGDEVWISHRILNDDAIYTLDNMTISDISVQLDCPIKIGRDNFKDLIEGLVNV
tara:strand:+ start:77 stop:1363 length:1287 start_codon:yes stop_codon:yes gene_type:complete